MSSIPTIRQTRRSTVLADGSIQFEVITEVTQRGSLPFPHVFVFKVTSEAEPKDDVYVRVATPVDIRQADDSAPIYVKASVTDIIRVGTDPFVKIASYSELSRLPRDRILAAQTKQQYYLSPVAAFVYDNLVTADAAAKQIIDRLSALVTDWQQYSTEFETNPFETYTLPQPGSSVESERTDVFKAARTARLAADAQRDADAEAKAACERDCESDKVLHQWLVTQTALLEQAENAVSAMDTSAARDFVLKQGASATDSRSYRDILIATRADRDTYAARVQTCALRCAQLGATLLASQQAADAALRAEQTALADVVAVCPTFNPDTV